MNFMEQGKKRLLSFQMQGNSQEFKLVSEDHNQFGLLIYLMQLQSSSENKNVRLFTKSDNGDENLIQNTHSPGTSTLDTPSPINTIFNFPDGLYIPPQQEIFVKSNSVVMSYVVTIYAYCLSEGDI